MVEANDCSYVRDFMPMCPAETCAKVREARKTNPNYRKEDVQLTAHLDQVWR